MTTLVREFLDGALSITLEGVDLPDDKDLNEITVEHFRGEFAFISEVTVRGYYNNDVGHLTLDYYLSRLEVKITPLILEANMKLKNKKIGEGDVSYYN